MTVTVSPLSEAERWQALKMKLKARFITITKAAAHFGCHPNALRLVASGMCPELAERVKQQGLI